MTNQVIPDAAVYELVDWTPARHPAIPLSPKMNRHKRRTAAWMCNMKLRRIGTTYIHNGGKP